MMRRVTLSNGVTVIAETGDTFGGVSGFQLVASRLRDDAATISDPKDLAQVKELALWFIREENKLRRKEGTLFNTGQRALVIENNRRMYGSPYDVEFLVGKIDAIMARRS